MNWTEVDAALARLRGLLEPRIGRSMTKQVFSSLMHVRESPDATPANLAAAIAQLQNSFGPRSPMGVPWSLADARVIRETAVRKLWDVDNRMRWHRPLRGSLPEEAQSLAEHADALAPAFPGDPPEFRVGIAYQNALTYQHHLVFGDPYNRNDATPVWALHAAASGQALSQGGRHHFTPIAVVPDRGVIWALGVDASPRLSEPWTPSGFMFIPSRGRSLRLDDVSDLRTFLAEHPLEIRPHTLASIIWLLAAPFPWEAQVQMDAELMQRFVPLETAYEDTKSQGTEAAALLGIARPSADESVAELRLRLDPPGVEVRYRAGKLEIL